jgi:hypothetical protein
MAAPWEVTRQDIEAIPDTESVHALLQRVLECELAANQLSIRSATVCLNVTKPDGGEDGLVTWDSDPPETPHIPLRRALFQIKRGHFAVADFKNEPYNVKRERIGGKSVTTKTLKPRVDENLDNGGAYIFFCSGVTFTPEEKEEAIASLREKLGARAASIPIRIYGSNDIASWVNQFAAAKLLVLGWQGKSDAQTFMTWEEWDSLKLRIPNPPYVRNAQMDALIAQIQDRFKGPGQVLRLIGQSGLGKTRTLLEAFRPPTEPHLDTPQAMLSGSMIYIYEGVAEKNVPSSIGPLLKGNVSGTIIIDDCKETTHLELAPWIGRADSKLNLITIDYQIEEDRTSDTVQLLSSDKDLIKGILHGAGFTDADIGVLADYCDGFPAIAALLASLPPDKRQDFYKLTPSQITQRLVWGRSAESYDGKSYDALATCALFSQFGLQSPYASHLEYIAHVCELTASDVHRRLSIFIKRGVIDTFGSMGRVIPIPLAVKLWDSWRERFGEDAWNALFNDNTMPGDLKTALGEQFTQLQGIKKAQSYVEAAVEPSAPFGKAEVLNTAQGSRVFRSLATVNPHAALQTLVREFGSMSYQDLTNVGPGRRSLMWALETIVFNRDLFVPAARLIARFALAENERNIGNNASGVFEHLYFMMLSGTEAPPLERLPVIDELLAAGYDTAIILALGAVSNAFGLNSATRMLGAERQQGKELKDWSPETYGDMYQYFDAAMDRLVRFAGRQDGVGKIARKGISDAVRTLVRYKRFDTVEGALRSVISEYQKAWPEAVSGVQDSLKYEDLKDIERERVASWLELLQPKDFAEQVRLVISSPPVGNMAQDDSGNWIDLNEVAAERFAAMLCEDYKALIDTIPLVSSGEQREGHVLGRIAAERLNDDQTGQLAERAFCELEKAGMDGNASFLCGILTVLRPRQPEFVKGILDQALLSKFAVKSLVYLTMWTQPTEADLERLYRALENKQLDVDAFRRFVYGAVLKGFPAKFINDYFTRFLKYGIKGSYVALYVVSSYIRDETQWKACKGVIRKAVSMKGMVEAEQLDTMDSHYFQEAVKRLLNDPKEQTFAKRLSREIVRICKLKRFNFNAYSLMQPAVFDLLGKHQQSSWPIFKTALSAANAMADFHLRHAFASNLTMRDMPKSALALVSDAALLAWCEEVPRKAPAFVLSSITLFSADEVGNVTISPLVWTILERYGSDSNVRSAMTSNLESFSITGSATPLYEQRVKLMKQLINIKNTDVAAWAAEYLASFEKRLKNQRMRDEEHEHGVLTPFFAGEVPEDQVDGNIM